MLVMGGTKKGSCPHALASHLPPKKNFHGNTVACTYRAKQWLIEWDFCKTWQISVNFFAFPNTKKQEKLWLPWHVQKLSVSASRGFAPWSSDQGLCPWTLLHLFDAHNNWITVDICPPFLPNKFIAPVPWPLPASFSPSLQIPSAAHDACVYSEQQVNHLRRV